MKRLRLVLAAALFLLPGTLAAQRTLVLQSFDAELRVQPSGDVEVTETIRARFDGSWNGIYRNLSLAHQTAAGRQERLDVEIRGATDEEGQELRVEASSQGRWTRRLQVWVPGAQDVTRTIVIRYVVRNAIRFFPEDSEFGHIDELYWNVTGNEWEVPIERASARIILPDGVTPSQSSGYTGYAGSTDQNVDISASGNVVTFTARGSFQPGEGLTVASGWPAGVLTRPSAAAEALSGTAEKWPATLPFLAFFYAFREWRRKGRDPEPRAIVVQYEPPSELGPTETGTLVDNKAHMHDVTASLVDLAVRAFIHIEKRESKTLGVFSSTDYVFHLKRPRDEWGSLKRHERRYLSAIFKHAGAKSVMGKLKALIGDADEEPPIGVPREGAGEGPTYGSVELSALKNEFYKDLPKIKEAVYQQLVDSGHYARSPSSVMTRWIIAAVIVGIAGVAAAAWASENGFPLVSPTLLGGGAVASALILLGFGAVMPARTVLGARSREAALGFKEFLAKVEEDRFRRMITSPEMFERYLPYAMALKVEKNWAKAFEDMLTDPPRWYTGYGGGGFHPTAFTSDINALTSAASSTMSSSPSGSGGGGSSGGGSGGGGGGGF